MVAPDNKKSSGISKEYVLETPINDQWHRKSTINIFILRENININPKVNTATEQGITGEVIVGNDMPRANENIGYIKGNINKIMDNRRCLPVLSKVVYPLIVSHNQMMAIIPQ